MHTQKSLSGVVFFSQELLEMRTYARVRKMLSTLTESVFSVSLAALAPAHFMSNLRSSCALDYGVRGNYQRQRKLIESARGYQHPAHTFCVLFSSVAQFGTDNFFGVTQHICETFVSSQLEQADCWQRCFDLKLIAFKHFYFVSFNAAQFLILISCKYPKPKNKLVRFIALYFYRKEGLGKYNFNIDLRNGRRFLIEFVFLLLKFIWIEIFMINNIIYYLCWYHFFFNLRWYISIQIL